MSGYDWLLEFKLTIFLSSTVLYLPSWNTAQYRTLGTRVLLVVNRIFL